MTFDWVDSVLFKFINAPMRELGFGGGNYPIFEKRLLEDIKSGKILIWTYTSNNGYDILLNTVRLAFDISFDRIPCSMTLGNSLFRGVLLYRLEVGR